MSTAEIIAKLPQLTPEERAQVQAKLDELAAMHLSSAAAQVDAATRAYYAAGEDAEDEAWGKATAAQSPRAWDED